MTGTVSTLWLGGVVALGNSRGGAGGDSRARAVGDVLMRQLLMGVLMAVAAPQPALSKLPRSLRHEPSTKKVWRARSVEGTIQVERHGESHALPAESRVKLRFEEDRILLFRKSRLVFIPAAAGYDTPVFSAMPVLPKQTTLLPGECRGDSGELPLPLRASSEMPFPPCQHSAGRLDPRSGFGCLCAPRGQSAAGSPQAASN